MFALRGDLELSQLDDQLQSYIRRMKEMKTGVAYLDSANFLKAIASVEKQLSVLKQRYESELTKLRNEMSDVKSSISKDEHKREQLSSASADLTNKVDSQIATNDKLKVSLNESWQALTVKEEELQKIQIDQEQHQKSSTDKICSCTEKLNKALSLNAELKQRVKTEEVTRKECEDILKQLENELQFKREVAEKDKQDLEDHLTTASSAILKLEAKVRHMGRPEHEDQVEEMLSAINNSAQADLYHYKIDAERTFSREISMLNAQAEAERHTFSTVTNENRRLMACIEELNTKIRNLQGQIIELTQSKCSAEENLKLEQERTNRHIQALDVKLCEQQEILFDKMKELNLVKSQNLPLKAQVEALKTLINEESERLAMKVHKTPLQHEYNALNSDGQQAIRLMSDSNYQGSTTSAPCSNPPDISGSATSLDGHHCIDSVQYKLPSSSSNVPPKYPVSSELGKGRDYFMEMFNSKSRPKSTSSIPRNVHKEQEPQHSVYTSKSSLGPLMIYEINEDGRYIIIHNSSDRMDLEIGGYKLQQNRASVPTISFEFPRVVIPAGAFITVYTNVCSPELHQPPTQFIWKDQSRWFSPSECTTVLCKPNGRAVAWVNAPYYNSKLESPPFSKSIVMLTTSRACDSNTDKKSLPLKSQTAPPQQSYLKSLPESSTSKNQMERIRVKCHSASVCSARSLTENKRTLSHSATGLKMGSAPIKRYVPSAVN